MQSSGLHPCVWIQWGESIIWKGHADMIGLSFSRKLYPPSRKSAAKTGWGRESSRANKPRRHAQMLGAHIFPLHPTHPLIFHLSFLPPLNKGCQVPFQPPLLGGIPVARPSGLSLRWICCSGQAQHSTACCILATIFFKKIKKKILWAPVKLNTECREKEPIHPPGRGSMSYVSLP